MARSACAYVSIPETSRKAFMGKRRRSGRSRTTSTAKAEPKAGDASKSLRPEKPAKRPLWRSMSGLAGKKLVFVVGLILTVLITNAVSAFTNAKILPWYRTATGQPPLAAQAFEEWSVSDTVDRVIPPGENSELKSVLAAEPAQAQSAGIAVGTLKAHLVVQAEDTTVTIVGMKLVAHRLKPVTDGTLIFTGSQGGGKAIQLYFDADLPDSVGMDSDGDDYFADGSYVTLQPGEATEFDLQVKAKSYYSQFTFLITVFADGRLSEVPVTDRGQPFQIAAPSRQYGAVYTVPLNSPDLRWVRMSSGVFCQQNPGVCA
jgi:hypothetical protein